MGRSAQGWRLRTHKPTGIKYVRFRHAGRRYDRPTSTRDPAAAAVEAARIYAEIVSGRKVVRAVGTALDVAVANYLKAISIEYSADWAKIVETYFNAHFLPFFDGFDAFTPASYGDYVRARIQRVTRTTVRHELSALRRFVEWCGTHGIALPPVPSVPKHGHAGKRAANARKRKATILDPAEASRILSALPERSKRSPHHAVRAVFVVLWETGLRPITVLRLEAPLNYRRGQDHLFISREVDKEGFERKVILSRAARAALDSVCPDAGRIFTASKSALRHWFDAALVAAGLEGLDASPYDLKHTRISIGANTAGVPLGGIAHMVGHKHISTTALYVQTGEAANRQALEAMGAIGGTFGGKNRTPGRRTSKNRGAKEGT